MYDTVEIPLMPNVSFSGSVAPVKAEVEAHVRERAKSDIPFRTNPYYEEVVDLRKLLDVDAVLHLNARKTGTHKIQIVEAGRKCRGEIAQTISQIVDDHPELLGVSRVDSCADIVDGPDVRWIAQSARARVLQWQAQFGETEVRDSDGRRVSWSEMGKREVQTMYIGKRPNCFRIYDKLHERQMAWKKEKRKHELLASQIVGDAVVDGSVFQHMWRRDKGFSAGLAKRLVRSGKVMIPFPDFETWFTAQCVGPLTHLIRTKTVQMVLPGQEPPEQLELIPQLPRVLTRVERQMAAGRVPDELNTFEKLFSVSALDFNPFDRLDFSMFEGTTEIVLKHRGPCDKTCQGMQHYSPVDLLAGMQIRQLLETGMSYQQVFSLLDRQRNGKRLAVKFAPFVAAANPPKAVCITSSELYECYRDSVSRQMAA